VGALNGFTLSPPQKLLSEHDLSEFDSGEPVLDDWLRGRAVQQEASGASSTYVFCGGNTVVGYYSLALGAVSREASPGQLRGRRNQPDRFPVIVLSRLAVDQSFQGRGIGTGLLRDAVLRTVQAAEIAGIRGIVVHAISERAKRFYEGYGFIPSPLDPMTVLITVAEAERILSGKRSR
jgi:GNAT superfamily N-acetyltransferase